MFSLKIPQIAHPLRLVITAVITVAVVSACSGGKSTPVPNATNTLSVTTTVTQQITTPSPVPTKNETAWMKGTDKLARRMEDAVGGSVTVTTKWLHSTARQLGTCSAVLSQVGPATDRLQPVLMLAKQGCAKYEEAAKCFATTGPVSSRIEDCFDAVNKASQLFSTAKVTGSQILDATN
jgi:hypothetical protein